MQKQTTPQINPEAVLSHEKSAPVLPQAAPDLQPLPDIHPGAKLNIELVSIYNKICGKSVLFLKNSEKDNFL